MKSLPAERRQPDHCFVHRARLSTASGAGWRHLQPGWKGRPDPPYARDTGVLTQD